MAACICRRSLLVGSFGFVALFVSARIVVAQRPEPEPPRQAFPFAPFESPDEILDGFFGDASEDELNRIEVTVGEEKQFGDAALEAFLVHLRQRRVRVVQRGPDVDYLRVLVAKIAPQMQHRNRYPSIRVLVADSPETDARCFPGGTIVVFRGLLEFAESEAAIVGVLGHELSHIDRQHQLRDVRRMKLAQQTFAGQEGGSPERWWRQGSVLMRSMMRPFRPEDERAADQDGARWAFELGYDPGEFARLFLQLHERDGKAGGPPIQFLRTHPFHLDRYHDILRTREQLQRENPARGLYIGRSNLERRITRDVQEFAD